MSLPTLSRRRVVAAAAAAWSAPWWSTTAAATTDGRRFAPRPGSWRRYELVTTVAVPQGDGATRVWLPVTDLNTDYQRTCDHRWTTNAVRTSFVADPARAVRMLYAEFDPADGAPELTLTTRLQTRDRAVDWSQKQRVAVDAAELREALRPTALLPLDGIVHETARRATAGARSDVDKARALYDWVIAAAHREPKVRGCGNGDIEGMLETGNLGGKCADLNALFVGLCRSVGVPARDVYGVRLAPSAFGYRELGGNPVKLQGAQHCRAEVFLRDHGWVAMDPADVLKVMRQETAEWIRDPRHPVVAPVAAGLFGAWEGNWAGYNTAHDVVLPKAQAIRDPLPFLMYPNGENDTGRFDELSPDTFRYTIHAREIA